DGVHLALDALGALEHGPPCRRGHVAAALADEQRRPVALRQRRDAARDRRLAAAERRRGGGERPGALDREEDAEVVPLGHAPMNSSHAPTWRDFRAAPGRTVTGAGAGD